jgi:AraC-like DNA-binding protein
VNDPFATLLRRFELKSRVFFAGKLCSTAQQDIRAGQGHLHLLRRGQMAVLGPQGQQLLLSQPSVMFLPRPTAYCLSADEPDDADLVCATVELGAQLGNPLVAALPALMVLPLAQLPALQGVLEALFAEAFAEQPGREAAVDRLGEVVLLYLLRHAIQQGQLQGGVVAALADSRLSKAMQAMHEHPAQAWTLSTLADLAGMSRARFAAQFMTVVGTPPAEYLALWRLSLAQGLLAQGRALKTIADEVGYGSTKALSRAFSQRVGCTPTVWLARDGQAKPR